MQDKIIYYKTEDGTEYYTATDTTENETVYYKSEGGTEFYTYEHPEEKDAYIPLKPFVILFSILCGIAVALVLCLK